MAIALERQGFDWPRPGGRLAFGGADGVRRSEQAFGFELLEVERHKEMIKELDRGSDVVLVDHIHLTREPRFPGAKFGWVCRGTIGRKPALAIEERLAWNANRLGSVVTASSGYILETWLRRRRSRDCKAPHCKTPEPETYRKCAEKNECCLD